MNMPAQGEFQDAYQAPPTVIPRLAATELVSEHQTEVLEFLAQRPIDTVFMAGLIRDNGMVSPRNRGSFYGVRGDNGQLEGVALVGHFILVDARSQKAVTMLAQTAQGSTLPTLMRGERNEINRFWDEYRSRNHSPRMTCRELMLEQRQPISLDSPPHLEPANLSDLEKVIAVNVQLFIEASGRNPLDTNRDGFRERIADRIKQGRVWTCKDAGEIVFKADVVAETPNAIYLESVYVSPAKRGKGYGHRCLSQLGSILLTRTQAICLTVNEDAKPLTNFYLKAGYNFHSSYETIYL